MTNPRRRLRCTQPNRNPVPMSAVLYARRSTSDRDERQVQSIEDQVRLMRAKAKQENLTIAQELTESQSAKAPHNRPQFEQMLRLLDAGEADAILCWHLNRLFRNSVDMAAIQWRLQKGVIRRIVTPDRVYLPEDNVLLFYMEAGVSNQTVLDLSKAVRRGMQSKIEKGWSPHRAPAGYLNEKWQEKGQKTIIVDPERFDVLRQAWSLLLSGGYTVGEVRRVLNDKWHYRSLQRKRTGGEPMALTTLYSLFSNPFYAGYFVHNGRWHRGAHQPMVTWAEFERAQEMLSRPVPFATETETPSSKAHRQQQKNNLTYCGLMHCTLCGGLVTGHTVRKKSGRNYTYYFCQNASGTCRKISVNEEKVDELVNEQLSRLFLLPEFDAWARQELETWRAETDKAQGNVARGGSETVDALDRQLESLLSLKIKELISDDEFASRRLALLNEKTRLQGALEETEQNQDAARSAIENALDFVANAQTWFAEGDANLRRAIVSALASNLSFTRGNVLLEPHPLLEELRREHEKLAADLERIKLNKSGFHSRKSESLEGVHTVWSRHLANVQQLALNNSWYFPRLQDQQINGP